MELRITGLKRTGECSIQGSSLGLQQEAGRK